MKILFISESSQLNGTAADLLRLVLGIKELGHECAVMLPDAKGPMQKKLKAAEIQMFTEQKYGLSIYPRCINPFKRRKRLEKLQNRDLLLSYVGYVLDCFKPDIVHTNVGPMDFAAEVCRLRGIPHVWHLREYQDLDFKMKFYPSPEKFSEMIHGDWNRCIAITADIFSHFNLRLCDRVIYDGVFDEGEFVSDGQKLIKPAENTAGEAEEKYFLYTARIEKSKGFDILARAFRKFIAENEGWKLVVAGRPCGFYAFRWKLFCHRTLPKGSVKFLGQSDRVAELMRGAAATVVPSRFEAFGFTAAEAMLQGCTVIGRDTAGTKEQFDNGLRQTGREIGLRFGADTAMKKSKLAEELAEKLSDVAKGLGDKELDALHAAARKVVVDNYGARRCARQVEEFYKEILSGK
jgi:L-malate glycosyltransferase